MVMAEASFPARSLALGVGLPLNPTATREGVLHPGVPSPGAAVQAPGSVLSAGPWRPLVDDGGTQSLGLWPPDPSVSLLEIMYFQAED